MERQICKNCKSQSFYVYNNVDCSACSKNYVWSDKYDDFIKPNEKNCVQGEGRRVEYDGECEFGTSNNEGCFVIKCERCNKTSNFIAIGYS